MRFIADCYEGANETIVWFFYNTRSKTFHITWNESQHIYKEDQRLKEFLIDEELVEEWDEFKKQASKIREIK